MTNDNIKSAIVEKTFNMINHDVAALGGLLDYHIKFIQYMLKNEMGIEHYQLKIDYINKVIVICVKTTNNETIYCKPKNPSIFDMLAKYLHIPQYKIGFEKRQK